MAWAHPGLLGPTGPAQAYSGLPGPIRACPGLPGHTRAYPSGSGLAGKETGLQWVDAGLFFVGSADFVDAPFEIFLEDGVAGAERIDALRAELFVISQECFAFRVFHDREINRGDVELVR